MEQVDYRRLRAMKGLLVQFDPADGIAQRCQRARFGSGGTPGPQQPLNDRQQEIATPKRGFQQPLVITSTGSPGRVQTTFAHSLGTALSTASARGTILTPPCPTAPWTGASPTPLARQRLHRIVPDLGIDRHQDQSMVERLTNQQPIKGITMQVRQVHQMQDATLVQGQ